LVGLGPLDQEDVARFVDQDRAGGSTSNGRGAFHLPTVPCDHCSRSRAAGTFFVLVGRSFS
jgi:hypothetical protein